MKKFLFLSLALILGNGFVGAQNVAETSVESSQEIHKYEGAIKIDWIYANYDNELSMSRMLNSTYSYVLAPQTVRLKTGEIHCWRDRFDSRYDYVTYRDTGISEHLYGYYENGKRNKMWKYELKRGYEDRIYTANIAGLYNNSKKDGLWSMKTTGVKFEFNERHYLANRDIVYNYNNGMPHGDFEMIISGNGLGIYERRNIAIEIKGQFLDGKITGDYTAETKIVNDEGILEFHCVITQSDENRNLESDNFGNRSIYFPMTGKTTTYKQIPSLEHKDQLNILKTILLMNSLQKKATDKFFKFEMPQDNEL